MTQGKLNVDGVFEGGGVKLIGLVGALSVIEAAGYEFVNLAGTSAGAIVASLLAAGYSAADMKTILDELDFTSFLDASLLGNIPLAGHVFAELFEKGLYKGDAFLNKMRDWLAQKKIHTFADLVLPGSANDDPYHFKLRVVASDISQGQMLVLPQDIRRFKDIHGNEMQPEELEVALAVRMSMSIPFLFMPVKQENSYIVDGGLLSNFPVDLFDSDDPPAWPTFGFKLVLSDQATVSQLVRHPISGPISELVALFLTAMEGHDAYYLRTDKFVRTITIDTLNIGSTDFQLTADQKAALYESGVQAAQTFLDHWDFEKYKELYRSGQPAPTRREQVLPRAVPPLLP